MWGETVRNLCHDGACILLEEIKQWANTVQYSLRQMVQSRQKEKIEEAGRRGGQGMLGGFLFYIEQRAWLAWLNG